MKTLSILLAAILALLPVAPALAFDRVLPPPRIKDNGDIRLSDDVKIGRFQGGKYVATPDALAITGAPASPVDLITTRPDNGHFAAGNTANGAPYQCEPILGPFHGAAPDLTRCQSARYFTTTGDVNKGEYGTIWNMVSNTGFPTACARSTYYPEFGTCLNDSGKMYRVKEKNGSTTYFGTSAASGSGPTGTSDTIVDGGVTWRYEPNFAPGNGGKTNFSLMSYQDANSGPAWTGAFAHQIATGGYKKNAFAIEIDLNNYWGDYSTGPAGPAATALQIFMGGPRRSTSAFSIGQYDLPGDSTSTVNAITICCETLARDNTIYDLTRSINGFFNQGIHPGSSFTDGSASPIAFNAYGGNSTASFRSAGGAVGLKLDGSYSEFQIQGSNWNVNPAGVITTAAGITVTAGAFKPAQYTVAGLFPCAAGSKGSLVVVTDLSAAPTYRQTSFTGGGSISTPVFCNGASWEAH